MKVMQEVHDVPMVGFYGERTTMMTLSKNIYWTKMKKNI
jgi:hypothetical protein